MKALKCFLAGLGLLSTQLAWSETSAQYLKPGAYQAEFYQIGSSPEMEKVTLPLNGGSDHGWFTDAKVYCCGLDHVATILHELIEKIRPQKLVEAAELVPLPWVQRLGYLLYLVGGEAKTKGLQKLIEAKKPAMTPLQPGISMQGSSKDRTFRVAVNSEVEPDL